MKAIKIFIQRRDNYELKGKTFSDTEGLHSGGDHVPSEPFRRGKAQEKRGHSGR